MPHSWPETVSTKGMITIFYCKYYNRSMDKVQSGKERNNWLERWVEASIGKNQEIFKEVDI